MMAKDRLMNGLHKLNETNSLVDGMKEQLAQLAPVLEAKSKSTAELLAKVRPYNTTHLYSLWPKQMLYGVPGALPWPAGMRSLQNCSLCWQGGLCLFGSACERAFPE